MDAISKHYAFWSASSIASIVTAITHSISEELDNKCISSTVALDISNAIDKVWYRGFLLKLISYTVVGKVFPVKTSLTVIRR